MNTWRNDKYLNSPYFAVLHQDDRITTLHTLWTTPLVTTVRNSYAHVRNCLRLPMVLKSEAQISIISNLLWNAQGNGWLATQTQKVTNGCQVVIQGQGHRL